MTSVVFHSDTIGTTITRAGRCPKFTMSSLHPDFQLTAKYTAFKSRARTWDDLILHNAHT